MLMQSGADKAAKDANGDTALDWAERHGNSDVAKMLKSGLRE